MAEILEYALVVLVGSLFVGGSVAVYSAFASAEAGVSLRASYDEIHWLASRAVANGSSSASLLLPPSTVSCSGGVLTVSAGGSTESGTVPAACEFSVSLGAGEHRLLFSDEAASLGLAVG